MWYCDKCGGKIDNVEEGWIEWRTDIYGESTKRASGMRLVHRIDCLYPDNTGDNTIPADRALKSFSGPDGLINFIEMLQYEEFKNNDEVYEMIKRVHVPGYEEARRHFCEAVKDGVIESDAQRFGVVYQSEIETILKEYKE